MVPVRGAALVAAASLTGCSWVLMDRHENTAAGRPLCSTTNGWAALDGLAAAATFVSAGFVNSAGQDAADAGLDVNAYRTEVALMIVYGALHSISAITGVSWASSCRAEIDRFEAGGAAAAPVPLGLAPRSICFDVESDGAIVERCGLRFDDCDRLRAATVAQEPGAPLSACFDKAGPPAPLVRAE